APARAAAAPGGGRRGSPRVEPPPAYATQCQVTNSATKSASSAAETARTGSCARGRAASQLASQMLRGNSTTRKRGSDIRGWELTGEESGNASAASTYAP